MGISYVPPVLGGAGIAPAYDIQSGLPIATPQRDPGFFMRPRALPLVCLKTRLVMRLPLFDEFGISDASKQI